METALLIGGALGLIAMVGFKIKRTQPTTTSQNGINNIKSLEGFSNTPYKDANGFSIGYGHFILPHENYSYITREEGEQILRRDLDRFEAAVRNGVIVPITQSMFDALVSFTYNVGVSAFNNSTLLRLLNDGDYIGASNQFPRWNKSQGQTLQALINRREKEGELFWT